MAWAIPIAHDRGDLQLLAGVSLPLGFWMRLIADDQPLCVFEEGKGAIT
jgi:hypothetical protein